MNKGEFVKFIVEQNKDKGEENKDRNLTQKKAEEIVDIFTSSVIAALGQGREISLVGFGNFSVSRVEARSGRNPRTGEPMQIPAYNQPKFRVGQKLKDACNPK